MKENNQLNVKKLFNSAFQNQKKKNFKIAISQYKKLIDINPVSYTHLTLPTIAKV